LFNEKYKAALLPNDRRGKSLMAKGSVKFGVVVWCPVEGGYRHKVRNRFLEECAQNGERPPGSSRLMNCACPSAGIAVIRA